MHPTALLNGARFFDAYVSHLADPLVVDLGSLDIFGSFRSVLPSNARYVGVDLSPGKGVDLVLADPYVLPFETGSIDVVVSTSCFEHCEFFWVTFLEIMRVLKPSGLFYLNAPSNGVFHRFPVDCWRFYPESGQALARWAQLYGINAVLAESFVSDQYQDRWNDFVCVILRDKASLVDYPKRMLHAFTSYKNGLCHPDFEHFLQPAEFSEDQIKSKVDLALST